MDLRENLKAAIEEQRNTESQAQPQETGEAETTVSESSNEGHSQHSEQKAPLAQFDLESGFEFGGVKYKSLGEAQKWANNMNKLYGRQGQEVKKLRDEMDAFKKSDDYRVIQDYKQHPKLRERIMGQYKEYETELAGGATKKEAREASGLSPELIKKIEEADKFREEMMQLKKQAEEQAFHGQIAMKIDTQEKELRAAYPDIDDEMVATVMDFCALHKTLTLKQGYHNVMAEVNAQRLEAMKESPSAKMPIVKATESKKKKLDLSKPADSKQHAMNLLQEVKKLQKQQQS